MTRTNIDTLFQAIAPATDRGGIGLRPGGNGPGFGDHLSKASTCAGARSNDERTTTPSRPTGQHATGSEENKLPNCPPPKRAQTEGADGATDREGDDEGANETATMAVGASDAAHAASTISPPEDPASPDTDKNAKVQSKGALAKQLHVAETPAPEVQAVNAAEDAAAAPAPASAPRVAAEATRELESRGAVETVDPVADQEVAKESTEPRTDKSSKVETRTAGELKTPEPGPATANEIANQSEAPVSVGVSAEPAAEAQPAVADKPRASKQSTAEREAAVEDNSALEANSDNHDASPVESASAAKTAATAIAQVAIPNAADSASAADKAATKDGEHSTKPVAANSEAAAGALDRLSRATSEVAGGNRPAEGAGGPQVDPARFVNRVAKAFHRASERGGALQIRLSPPELGALKIQLTVKDGVMSAALETENAGARRVLLDNLPALRGRLAEQNIRIEKFDVNVRQDGGGGQANPQGSNHNPYQPQADRSSPRAGRGPQPVKEASSPVQPAPAVHIAQISSSGINLFV